MNLSELIEPFEPPRLCFTVNADMIRKQRIQESDNRFSVTLDDGTCIEIVAVRRETFLRLRMELKRCKGLTRVEVLAAMRSRPYPQWEFRLPEE